MVTQEPRERAVVTAGANAREPCAREARCTRGETTVPIGLGPYPRSVLPENHWEALYEANAELIDDIVADLQRLAQVTLQRLAQVTRHTHKSLRASDTALGPRADSG